MGKINSTSGSGNVFADLGIDDSEEYLRKADLAIRINEIVVDKRLTQTQAAALLAIDQPKVSLLKRGLLDAFSIERLMKFLRLLGQEHEIRPKKSPQSETRRPQVNRHSETELTPFPSAISIVDYKQLGGVIDNQLFRSKIGGGAARQAFSIVESQSASIFGSIYLDMSDEYQQQRQSNHTGVCCAEDAA